MRTLLCLLRKELILFANDKFLPKMALIFPCVVILVMPLVTRMDVRHVGVGIIDHDSSLTSRRIAADLNSSDYFSVENYASFPEAIEAVESGTIDVILEIAPNSSKNPAAKMPAISANGVNGIKGSLGAQYVAQAVARTLARQNGITIKQPVTVNYFYNPTLEYRNFMIPGLMIMLLIMLSGFMPALNLVSEKESGTLESINVTPVKTTVFMLSKLIPYWVIGIVVLLLSIGIAAAVYGLKPVGSIWVILGGAMLFIFFMSGIGVTIANFSTTMTQTMFVMFFIVMLFIMMSGLMTPVSSMPAWARGLTYAFPPRYFIEIMRSVYLKGTPASALGIQFSALAIAATAANLLAAATYRKQS